MVVQNQNKPEVKFMKYFTFQCVPQSYTYFVFYSPPEHQKNDATLMNENNLYEEFSKAALYKKYYSSSCICLIQTPQ